jgi:hypothetical protein
LKWEKKPGRGATDHRLELTVETKSQEGKIKDEGVRGSETVKKLLAILAVMLIVSFWVVLPARAVDPVNVLSSSAYVDSIGDYRIVGEVQNVGSQALKYVKITASFYSANDTFVGSDYSYTELSVLNSGDKSPFNLYFSQTAIVPQINHYSLYISYSSASALPAGLKILSNSSYVDNINYLHVIGQVQNIAAGNATYVEVIGTFYDQAGNVVDSDYTFTSPTTLEPNQIGPYDLFLYDTARIALVKSYSLTAESNEYSLQGTTPIPSPTPTATPTPTPSPTPTPTPTPMPTPTPTLAPTQAPNPTLTPKSTLATTSTPKFTPTPIPTSTVTTTPKISPTQEPQTTSSFTTEYIGIAAFAVIVSVAAAASMLMKRNRSAHAKTTSSIYQHSAESGTIVVDLRSEKEQIEANNAKTALQSEDEEIAKKLAQLSKLSDIQYATDKDAYEKTVAEFRRIG